MPEDEQQVVAQVSQSLEGLQFASLINSMTDAVIAVDENAGIELYNAAALNILDVNFIKPSTSLESVMKLIDKDNQPSSIVDLVKNSKQPTINRDLRLLYSDGSKINLFISIAPVHLGYGAKGKAGYIVLLRDITREKSLEEERDEFISVISHELRTPVAITEGNISNAQVVAEKGGDPNLIKTALNEAHNQIVFLAEMINDLSTLSRAERGTLEITIDSINVHDLVNELSHNYEPSATKKGLELKTEIKPDLELLYSSRLYVREVLQNFITNAIKYTFKGSVSVTAAKKDKGVLFTVHDTGIGISKSDQDRVFDKFFRSEDFRTANESGTGLGLYVTMKLSRLLHADITLDSALNQGSTFSIYIPNLK